jgi:putative transposase
MPHVHNCHRRTSDSTACQYDHDPLFRFHRWLANLRILEINEIKSIPYTPVSPPFVERLIGTIRREYLDQTLLWNSFDLARKLDEFKTYYNRSRVHQSLDGVPGELINQTATGV